MNTTLTLKQQRALDRERLRISQDIHDDVGARLTELILLSDLAQRSTARANELEAHIGRLSTVAREVARDLNAIVWAVNPHHDSTDSLAAYIFQYAKRYLDTASVRCRLEAPEELPHWPLAPDVRHNLFLVVKEALNNIVKHSRASEAVVSLEAANSTLLLTIQDNGRGFSPADSCACGNGLKNMQRRVRDISGRFELRSRSGQGTQIQVRLRVKTSVGHAYKRCSG
jgi:signal transduction histidine kinase